MPPTLSIHRLPTDVPVDQLAASAAVVVDILRASSTITTALAHGASAVIPCLTVEEATAWRDQLPPGAALWGGERGGQLIPGFDLDNSPRAYTRDIVAGKTIVFTTTNGTRALAACQSAQLTVLGSFLNRDAVAAMLRARGLPVHIVCAGTDGEPTEEDECFAADLAHQLLLPAGPANSCYRLQNDFAHEVCARWPLPIDRPAALQASRGGRNLRALGLTDDIAVCAALNVHPLVGQYSFSQQRIQIAV